MSVPANGGVATTPPYAWATGAGMATGPTRRIKSQQEPRSLSLKLPLCSKLLTGRQPVAGAPQST